MLINFVQPNHTITNNILQARPKENRACTQSNAKPRR